MSKSVSERKSDAAIGTRKKRPMTRSPGARKMAAARASFESGRLAGNGRPPPREHPAPLLQDPVDVRVELGQRAGNALPLPDRGLQPLRHVLSDLLPLRDSRHRRDVLDLDAKGAELLVVRERRVVPRGAGRGQVPGERVEPGL